MCLQNPSANLPKGPFRTKNTATTAKNSELLHRSAFTTPPRFTTPRVLLGEGDVCDSQENGVRTWCTAIVNHGAMVKVLRVDYRGVRTPFSLELQTFPSPRRTCGEENVGGVVKTLWCSNSLFLLSLRYF